MDFERLAHRHQDAVYAQMVRLCQSHEDAEDALVEALLLAYGASKTIRDESRFQSWLAKIARRVCYRIQSHPKFDQLIEVSDGTLDAHSILESNEMKTCLLDAIQMLPEKLREAYVLCEIEQHDDQTAATQLGLSLPALKSRLHRARIQMRINLEKSLCLDESFSR